ncbi:MAG: alpha/beta hydrolase [Myxococcaceae bacterium]|nr:MAG: alpha/beta hydrolase [Myxococcaceae bacterium]
MPLSALTSPSDDPVQQSHATRYRFVDVDGSRVFLREAGNPEAPTVLLLHGAPTSSFQFRHLIPALADRYHVVAPDYPGFGFTDVPTWNAERPVTFDALADTVERLTDVLGLRRFALYLFDYGAPVGFRLAERRPERVAALILQNGNAFLEGLGPAWAPVRAYWADPSPARRDALRGLFTEEGLRDQYLRGEPDPSRIAPECWMLDKALVERPGVVEVQLDLLLDYRHNLECYPLWQAFMRNHQRPALVTWGRNDDFFPPPGAEAYRRVLHDVEFHLLDAGHFALESNGERIASLMHDFLDRKVAPRDDPALH